MKYIEISVKTTTQGVEPLIAVLSGIGIDNVEVDDPHDAEEIMRDKEKYEWDYVDSGVMENMDRTPLVKIYLDADDAAAEGANAADEGQGAAEEGADASGQGEAAALEQQIRNAVLKLKEDASKGVYGDTDLGELTVTAEVKDDSAWKDKWKEYFKPEKVSERVVVKPTWEEYEEKDGEIVIDIDPGMAFGTGTHETTSMCIELLDRYVQEGDSVLDAGTGSGILSIAAAKLGASKVLGVDIDEEAIRVSKENFEKNGVSDVAEAKLMDITKGASVKADIVVANLMAELIVKISGSVGKLLEPEGIFISSGILYEKEEMVEEALEKAGFDVIDGLHRGEWVALVAAPAE